MTVSISERSVLLDCWRWLASGVPAWFVRLLEGRIASVRVPGLPVTKLSQPVRLLLGPELVLSRRLHLPPAARVDLPGAIRLLIEMETPFATEDLIVHAERQASTSETREAIYQVRMVPRAALLSAMAEQGIRPGRVIGIMDESAPDRTDFWRAAFPVRAVLRWTIALPVLISATCVGVHLVEAQSRRDVELANLTRVVSERFAELRQITDQVEARRQEQAGATELTSTLSASTSAYNILEQIRANLPPQVQVQRVELDSQTLGLSVRAQDALAVARDLGAKMSAHIDGAISVDPTSGLEMATIRVQQLTGDAQ